jgi:uncharacterized protein (DUF885 family)
MFKPYMLLILALMISALIGGCKVQGNPASETPTRPPPTAIALDFDTFVELSYRQLLSRDPETALELGLSQVYGFPTDQLTDISDEYIRQTQVLESDTLTTLTHYDRSSLTPAQQLTYDIYFWYLNDRVEENAFMYADYPINPTVFSVHLDLLQWFTDLRPVTNLQQAQDYVTCLSQVDTKFSQLIDGLHRREENGVILPNFLINYIIGDLNRIAKSPARSTPYYASFENKIQTLTALDDSDKQSLLKSAEEAINTSVLPAYQALVKYLEHEQTVATNDAGVWKFPNGEAYYNYALRHYTNTQMTADEIHTLGLQALDRIHLEMHVIFDQLGYPKGETIPQLFNRVAADSGLLTGEDIVKGYEDIITAIDRQISRVFDLRPSIGVIVKGDPIGGYYIPPAVDGSRPGTFYAQDTGYVTRYSMPTLAYHETIPGHHTQIAIAQQLDLPSFRRGADFTTYVEGWALYAEHLVSEMGIYEDDPYGNLGRLQAEAYRAARLVVDTGLHSKRWTFDQAVKFMLENTGMPEFILQSEVSRYISLPGQATAYYIGYTRIMELRQKAMDELGDRFDLKEFHNLLLGNGAMPLGTLEQVVDDYIQFNKNGG